HRLAAGQAAAVGVHHIEAVARLGLEVGRGPLSLTWPVASMLSNDASVPVRLQVLVSPASGSLAAAVYTTVLAARFSSTPAVAAEVTVGASLTVLMLRITALLPSRMPMVRNRCVTLDATPHPALQHNQLMTERRVLGLKSALRLEWRDGQGQEEEEE